MLCSIINTSWLIFSYLLSMYSLDNGLCLAWLFVLLALNNNSLVCHVVVNHYCSDRTRTLHNWSRFLNHFVSSSIPYFRQVLGICIQASWHFLEYFTTVRGHNRHERHCKGQVVPCSIQHKSTYITWYMPTRVAPCSCDDTVNATSPLKKQRTCSWYPPWNVLTTAFPRNTATA